MIIVPSNVASLNAPVYAGVSPTTGAAATLVTITGDNFVGGNTSVTFGGVAATQITVVSPNQLTCRIPSTTRGNKNIVITTSGGSVTATNAFFVLTPPELVGSQFTPQLGGSGTAISIVGANFLAGSTVNIGGSAATNVAVVNSGSITCNVPTLATAGNKSVVVNTSDGSVTSTASFVYYLIPTFTSVSPTNVRAGTTVTINGTNFVSGNTTVRFGGANGPAATSVNVTSSTSLTCVVPNLGGTNLFGSQLTITTPGGTLTTGTTVVNYYPNPVVSSVSPPQGIAGTSVTLTGTGMSGATVTIGGTSVSATTSNTSITFTVPNLSTDGARQIVVTNPAGGTGSASFTFYAPRAAETATYTSGSGNYTIPVWCNKVDVVCCGGGQGGGPGTGGVTGRGGQKGSWSGATVTRGSGVTWATTTLAYAVGAGGARGAAGTWPNPGANGSNSTAAGTVTGTGGSGDTGGLNGLGSGNYTFNGVTYTGSASVTVAGQAGQAPGGGGAGGGLFNGNGGTGAAGTVIFRAYQ